MTRRAKQPAGAPRPTGAPAASSVPPGLRPDKFLRCARCGQEQWIHKAYWRAPFIGAEHRFVREKKEVAS